MEPPISLAIHHYGFHNSGAGALAASILVDGEIGGSIYGTISPTIFGSKNGTEIDYHCFPLISLISMDSLCARGLSLRTVANICVLSRSLAQALAAASRWPPPLAYPSMDIHRVIFITFDRFGSYMARNGIGNGPERSIDAFCFGYKEFPLKRRNEDPKSIHFHVRLNIPEN